MTYALNTQQINMLILTLERKIELEMLDQTPDQELIDSYKREIEYIEERQMKGLPVRG